jgi:cysteine sulfinate desulfinase/cysteine desulfurase-like protein
MRGGGDTESVVFTASGSEADNLAIGVEGVV